VETTLSTQALRGIKTLALEDLYVTVRAGTPLADIQRELAQHKMWVPLVSPWEAATIGGLVASSFNAPLRMYYGAVRDLVLALTVVLPNGRLIRAGRPVVKNVAGYDLPKLFIGAHGTLGLITDVTLKLLPLPRAQASLVTPVSSLSQGARLGQRLLETCLAASALIVCPGKFVAGVNAPYALIHTIEGMPEDVATEMREARAALNSAGVAHSQEMSGNAVWASEMGAPAPAETRLRLGVAPQDLAGVLNHLEAKLEATPLIADVANGLLYLRSGEAAVIEAARQSAKIPQGYVVTLSAPERQSPTWQPTPDSQTLMAKLKACWNPQGLFNPQAFMV
jgi:FAD/FMN-containing dehydrogenase